MSERLKPTDVPGQPGSIQNTRLIIIALMDHAPLSGADAGELLSGLERLEAETAAEKVLKAPQVQDARGLVSSMLAKGFIPKESANSFLDRLEDPATAEVLKKYVLPVTNQGTQAATKTVDRRGFLAGALVLGGLVLGSNLVLSKKLAEDGIMYAEMYEVYKKILDTPFVADELPPGWYQVRSDPVLSSPESVEKSVSITFQIPGEEKGTAPRVWFTVFKSSEEARTEFQETQNSGSRSVSGIGDMARLNSVGTYVLNSNSQTWSLTWVGSTCFVVVDRILFNADGGQRDEQVVLSLAGSAVKYLARIGVTPGVK